MSDNEQTQAKARRCPVCEGDIASNDTICPTCRGELEKSVMAVQAADYPPPARVVQSADESANGGNSGASLEAQLDAAVDDDLDLLPLAPAGDFVRSAVVTVQPATPQVSTGNRIAAAIPAPPRPMPVSTPVEMDSPAKALQAQSRWKLALVAILITAAAGLLAAVIWSLVVPPQDRGPGTVPAASANPAPAISTP